ncbi:MAG: hypothetical protein WC944_02640, partial [Candidatus Cloacimonadaceae bacterium]|nr:hypothetical protein [Candidatus Cloacimonadota bacterium]
STLEVSSSNNYRYSPLYGTLGYCAALVCYLKYRPYRTQTIVYSLVCYLKYRPYRTQTIV